MKIASLIIGIVFLIFAAVQYNDPDPLLWMLAYGYVALVAFLAYANKLKMYMVYLGLAIFLIAALFYIPGLIQYLQEGSPGEIVESMQAKKPHIELGREFFGLFLCTGVMVFYWLKLRKA